MTSRFAFAVLALATSAQAQSAAQPATRQLGARDHVIDVSFTAVTGFRALADGRVIVADWAEKTLRLLDPRAGQATAIGREGAGPAEFGLVGRLYALAGDSTLMLDAGNDRFFLIDAAGRPAGTFRLTDGNPVSSARLLGADLRGRLYFERARPPASPGRRANSTGVVDLLRYDRTADRVDTLAQIARPKDEREYAKSLDGGMLQLVTNLPLAPRDIAAIAPDGRVAIVRGASYRVDWIATDGRVTRGAPAAAPMVRITDAEKKAFLSAQVRRGAIVTQGAPPGGASGSNRGAISVPRSALDDTEMTWPAIKPPFTGDALVSHEGQLWVQRSRAHDDSVAVYDVFDASGKVIDRVALPKGRRLAGFGRGVVYVVHTDEDDLLQVERYRAR